MFMRPDKICTDIRGFTLVEMLTVVAIMAVLVAITVLNSDFTKKSQLGGAARQLKSDIQKLRKDAMTTSTAANGLGFGIRFTANNSYTTFEFNDADTDFVDDGGAEETGERQATLSSPVKVTIGDEGDPTGDNNILIYDKRGTLRTNQWVESAVRTYVLKYPGISEAKCIKVEKVSIREGNWDGATCNPF